MSKSLLKVAIVWAISWCAFIGMAQGAGKENHKKAKKPSTAVVTVTVTQAGSPVAGRRVIGYDENGRRTGRIARTNANGIANITVFQGKTVTVNVMKNRVAFPSEPVPAPGAVTVELPADSSLTFTMSRKPVKKARVRILTPDGDRYHTILRTDANGYAAFTLPKELEFKLEIKTRGTTYITPVYTAPADVKFDPKNTAPVATDVVAEGVSGMAIPVPLSATDADGDALTYSYTQPANGTLSGTAPNLTYTSTAGFYGSDSFTYQATDGIASSADATVSVTVSALPFIISVDATDGTFTLPLKPGLTYDFSIAYDGVTTSHNTDANLTLTFPSGPGVYDVAISGTFPAIYFNNTGDKAKLMEVKQWGNIAWQTMEHAFFGCNNLQVNTTDKPNLSNVTSFLRTFDSCSSLTSLNVTNWDISNVKTMKWGFMRTGLQTLDVSTWDTGAVESFYRTFAYNTSLTLVGYENWDVSNVVEFMGTFQGFKGMTSIDITNWNTTDKLVNLRRTFAGSAFTKIKGLESLNISKIEIMESFLPNINIPTPDYDAILISWAAQVTDPTPWFPDFKAHSSKYTPFSDAAAAREKLIASNWQITDGGTVAGINGFTTTSITSPIRVSGWNDLETNTFTATVNGSAQGLTKWGDTLWYTDVALNQTQPSPFTVSYNGTVVKSGDLTWTPTLIDTTSSQSVTIRKGHSLLLGSAVQAGTLLEIDIDGDGVYDLSGATTDQFPVEYSEYGTFTVYTRIDNVPVGELMVIIPEIHFPQNVACEIGYTRELTVGVPEDTASNIAFSPLSTTDLTVTVSNELSLPGTIKLFIKPLTSGTPTIQATNTTTGAVLETKIVDEFDLYSNAKKMITVVEELEDGSQIVEGELTLDPIVSDLDVKIHIFVAGATFEDSTLGHEISSNDFNVIDGVGKYKYRIVFKEGNAPKPCHNIKAFQYGVQASDSPDNYNPCTEKWICTPPELGPFDLCTCQLFPIRQWVKVWCIDPQKLYGERKRIKSCPDSDSIDSVRVRYDLKWIFEGEVPSPIPYDTRIKDGCLEIYFHRVEVIEGRIKLRAYCADTDLSNPASEDSQSSPKCEGCPTVETRFVDIKWYSFGGGAGLAPGQCATGKYEMKPHPPCYLNTPSPEGLMLAVNRNDNASASQGQTGGDGIEDRLQPETSEDPNLGFLKISAGGPKGTVIILKGPQSAKPPKDDDAFVANPCSSYDGAPSIRYFRKNKRDELIVNENNIIGAWEIGTHEIPKGYYIEGLTPSGEIGDLKFTVESYPPECPSEDDDSDSDSDSDSTDTTDDTEGETLSVPDRPADGSDNYLPDFDPESQDYSDDPCREPGFSESKSTIFDIDIDFAKGDLAVDYDEIAEGKTAVIPFHKSDDDDKDGIIDNQEEGANAYTPNENDLIRIHLKIRPADLDKGVVFLNAESLREDKKPTIRLWQFPTKGLAGLDEQQKPVIRDGRVISPKIWYLLNEKLESHKDIESTPHANHENCSCQRIKNVGQVPHGCFTDTYGLSNTYYVEGIRTGGYKITFAYGGDGFDYEDSELYKINYKCPDILSGTVKFVKEMNIHFCSTPPQGKPKRKAEEAIVTVAPWPLLPGQQAVLKVQDVTPEGTDIHSAFDKNMTVREIILGSASYPVVLKPMENGDTKAIFKVKVYGEKDYKGKNQFDMLTGWIDDNQEAHKKYEITKDKKNCCLVFKPEHVFKWGVFDITYKPIKEELLETSGEYNPENEGWCEYETTDIEFLLNLPHTGKYVGIKDFQVKPEHKVKIQFEARKLEDQDIEYRKIKVLFKPKKATKYIPFPDKTEEDHLNFRQGPFPVALSDIEIDIEEEGDVYVADGHIHLSLWILDKLNNLQQAIYINPNKNRPKKSGYIVTNLTQATSLKEHDGYHVDWNFSYLKPQLDLEKLSVKSNSLMSILSLKGELTKDGLFMASAKLTNDVGPWKSGAFTVKLLEESHAGYAIDLPTMKHKFVTAKISADVTDIRNLEGNLVFTGQRNCVSETLSDELNALLTDEMDFEKADQYKELLGKPLGWSFICALGDDSKAEAFGFEIKSLDWTDSDGNEQKGTAKLQADFDESWDMAKFSGEQIMATRKQIDEKEKEKLLEKLKGKAKELAKKLKEAEFARDSFLEVLKLEVGKLEAAKREFSKLQNVSETIALLKEKIKTLEWERKAKRDEVHDLGKEKNKLKKELKSPKTRKKHVEDHIRDLENKLKSLDPDSQEYRDAESDLLKHKKELSTLNETIDSLQNQIADLVTKIGELKMVIEQIDSDIKSVEEELATYKKYQNTPGNHKKELARLEKEIEAGEKKVKGLMDDIAKAKKKVEEIEKELKKVNGDIVGITKDRVEIKIGICEFEVDLVKKSGTLTPKLTKLSLYDTRIGYKGFELNIHSAIYGDCESCTKKKDDFLSKTCDCGIEIGTEPDQNAVLVITAAVQLTLKKSEAAAAVAVQNFQILPNGTWDLGGVAAKFENKVVNVCFAAAFTEKLDKDTQKYVAKFDGCFDGKLTLGGEGITAKGSILIGVATQSTENFTFGRFSLNVGVTTGIPLVIPMAPPVDTGLNVNKIGAVFGWNVKATDPSAMTVDTIFTNADVIPTKGSWQFGAGMGLTDRSKSAGLSMYVVLGLGENEKSLTGLAQVTLTPKDASNFFTGNGTIALIKDKKGTRIGGLVGVRLTVPPPNGNILKFGGSVDTDNKVNSDAELRFSFNKSGWSIAKAEGKKQAGVGSLFNGLARIEGDASLSGSFETNSITEALNSIKGNIKGDFKMQKEAELKYPDGFNPTNEGTAEKTSDVIGLSISGLVNVNASVNSSLDESGLSGSLLINEIKMKLEGIVYSDITGLDSATVDVIGKGIGISKSGNFVRLAGKLSIDLPYVPDWLEPENINAALTIPIPQI